MSASKQRMDAIGLGTYRLGSSTESVCSMALEIGYRHIDTAALYRNEQAVARAIGRSGIPRDQVFVTSKIPSSAIVAGTIEAAAKQSLEHLQQIDLLLLHAPGPDPKSAWAEMQELALWDGIGEIGVSNFNVCHLKQLGSHQPKWNQVEVSPFLQRRETIHYCQQHNIEIVAHSPLVKGKKMSDPTLKTMASDCGCTPAQLLIAWSLNKGYIALPRSSREPHLRENLAARDIVLAPEIVCRLDRCEAGLATHPQHLG